MHAARRTRSFPAISAAMTGLLFTVTALHAQTTLFADNFDRPDSSDLNASTAGKSGTLGVLNYSTVTAGGAASIDSNRLKVRELGGGGGGWAIVYINDHNFTDSIIASGGGFSISIDIAEHSGSAGNGRFMGVGVGQSLAELTGLSGGGGPGQVGGLGDLVVGYDNFGTPRGIAVFQNGAQVGSHTAFPAGFPSVPDTLTVNYTFSDFNAGTTVNYEVFLDTTSVISGSTTWSGTNENYISMHSNLASESAKFDNLEIRANASALPSTFPLVIMPNDPTSLFKLEWDSQAGNLYRVMSNTGLGPPINTWSVVAADIAATPPTNSYNVDPADPRLFYAVEEYPAPPQTIFSENFDGTTPGSLPTDWATGKNNPPDTTSTTNWELGTPANVGPVPPGVPLPSAANCVGTNISGNYDDPVDDNAVPYTDVWLRTPAIDLGAATAGTLTFQQWTEIEVAGVDLDYGSIRILDANDDSLLAILEDRTIDGSTTGWEEYSMALPAAAFTAAAGTIKIEFRFEADDIDSFAGWYIDDVFLTVPGS